MHESASIPRRPLPDPRDQATRLPAPARQLTSSDSPALTELLSAGAKAQRPTQ